MKNLGLATPQILLPNKKINLKKWAVVACDQYNSNLEYWKRVEKHVGNNASTLHIILPEIYLDDDKEERILDITHEMEEYVANGVVEALPSGFVLVQRELSGGTRTGLIAMVDLEKYSFKPRKDTKIRPTEQTVMERIPPRVEIRKPALLESPHILVLLNDPRKKVIEPLVRRIKNFPTLYDFKLMENGGRIRGSFIGDKDEINELYERLDMVSQENDILFAVGDGNHSLATAKTVWDEFKQSLSKEKRRNHPKRFALVEIVNLYDEGLIFEPIHRVVFNVEPNALIGDLIRIFNRKKMNAKVYFKRSTASKFVKNSSGQTIDFIGKDRKGYIQIGAPEHEMESVNFQEVLDEYLNMNKNAKVEYIHGGAELERLCEESDTTGFILPKLDKGSFIDVLAEHGVLPKKCFSLGEADEKRYYLETRLLDEIIEVSEDHEMFSDDEQEQDMPEEDVYKEQEEAAANWLEKGNNEDVISFAFAENEEEELLDENRNEYLSIEEGGSEPEEFLSKKELRKLKRQQRIEQLLDERDLDEYGEEGSDEMIEEPLLSRKELRLLRRQEEYELLLGEINRIKEEQREIEDSEPKGDKTSVKTDIQDEETFETSEEELDEYERQMDEERGLSWRERRQIRKEERQQMLEEARKELEQQIVDEHEKQADDISNTPLDDLGEVEDAEMPLSRREQRAIRRQEKLEALLGELEQQEKQEEYIEEESRPLTKREIRAQRKEERRLKRLEEIEAWEREEEEYLKQQAEIKEEQKKDTEIEAEKTEETDEREIRKIQKLKSRSEIADALGGGDDELSAEEYELERARIKLEKEKLRLEKFKVREESRIKVQIEREKRKRLDKEQREAEKIRQQEELEQILSEVTEGRAIKQDKTKADVSPKKKAKEEPKRAKGLGGVLDEIISEVKEAEEKRKTPEKVIVRRDTNDIIGRTQKKEEKKRKRKEKRRRGTILIKRAGTEYTGPMKETGEDEER